MTTDKKSFTIDFPDEYTTNAYINNFYNTAGILGLDYQSDTFEFGSSKYHSKVLIKGSPKAISCFVNFVNESIKLGENIEVNYPEDKAVILIKPEEETKEEFTDDEMIENLYVNLEEVMDGLQGLDVKINKQWARCVAILAVSHSLLFSMLIYAILK